LFVLSFDFGTRYIGVAVGEMLTFKIFPVYSILTFKMHIRYFEVFSILNNWKPKYIIIGYPINEIYDNSKLLDIIDLFAFKIRCFYNENVIFVDENLSSWKARRILNKNKDFLTINSLSATILIQQWFLDNDFKNL